MKLRAENSAYSGGTPVGGFALVKGLQTCTGPRLLHFSGTWKKRLEELVVGGRGRTCQIRVRTDVVGDGCQCSALKGFVALFWTSCQSSQTVRRRRRLLTLGISQLQAFMRRKNEFCANSIGCGTERLDFVYHRVQGVA
ncbi:unnamed protein product [Hermetia illucens]|uniref:Uncharacterized protein n=1 Tax=Hermetia illucens TaxID=343691 RepID=A0A7R8YS83_HERIL|nr:unnamed protein product [Hermetia illucens]